MALTITERITKILHETDFEADFTASPEQLGMDSMDYVELGMLIEQEFVITMADADLYALKKKPLSDWVDYISKKLEK